MQEVIKGKREIIPEFLEKEHPILCEIIKDCWSKAVNSRPSAEEIYNRIKFREILAAKTIEDKITEYKKERLNDPDILNNLKFYIPPRASNLSEDIVDVEYTYDLEKFVSETFFSSSILKVLLILAPAGAGKSTFLQFTENSLLKNFNNINKDTFPIFIHLPTIADVNQELLQKHFKQFGFKYEDVDLMLNKYNFILLLDGFDEVSFFANIYRENQFTRFHNLKVIIACRRNSAFILENSKNYTEFFCPFQDSKKGFNETNIVLFHEDQVLDYVDKFLSHYSSLSHNKNRILSFSENEIKRLFESDNFRNSESLRIIIKSPFLLFMFMKLLVHADDKKNFNLSNFNLLFLYKSYIKLSYDLWDPFPIVNQKSRRKKLKFYALQIANLLFKSNSSQILLESNNDYPQHIKDKFLIPPIKLQGSFLNKFSFFHASFIDYFVFLSCYKDFKKITERQVLENQNSLFSKVHITSPLVIEFFVLKLFHNQNLRFCLLHEIQLSKNFSNDDANPLSS